MQTQLPETVDFALQVERNRTIEGEFPLSKLERLGALLSNNEGSITAKLVFGYTVGIPSLEGNVSAKLQVECQRCLQPLDTVVSGSFKFALVKREEDIEMLPDELEPYLLEGDEQSIIELLEDELLLSLPMVAVHKNACSEILTRQEKARKAEKEASHPFAALKALKDDLTK